MYIPQENRKSLSLNFKPQVIKEKQLWVSLSIKEYMAQIPQAKLREIKFDLTKVADEVLIATMCKEIFPIKANTNSPIEHEEKLQIGNR